MDLNPSDLSYLGLDEQQSKVFGALLQQGEGSAESIASKAGVEVSVAHSILDTLIERGFAAEISPASNSEKLFAPVSPENLFVEGIQVVNDEVKED